MFKSIVKIAAAATVAGIYFVPAGKAAKKRRASCSEHKSETVIKL